MRLQRFLPIEVVELRDPKHTAEESPRILSALDSSDRVIALDPKGKSWTSEEFAAFVAKHMREDSRRLTFVIGGFSGLSDAVKERADMKWSLSPLTFTHDLCRV